jgi:hypothetical protein
MTEKATTPTNPARELAKAILYNDPGDYDPSDEEELGRVARIIDRKLLLPQILDILRIEDYDVAYAILRAVNSHAALVKACKRVWEYHTELLRVDGRSTVTDGIVAEVVTALALAETERGGA